MRFFLSLTALLVASVAGACPPAALNVGTCNTAPQAFAAPAYSQQSYAPAPQVLQTFTVVKTFTPVQQFTPAYAGCAGQSFVPAFAVQSYGSYGAFNSFTAGYGVNRALFAPRFNVGFGVHKGFGFGKFKHHH